MSRTKTKAKIIITCSVDLEEFSVDIDEVPPIIEDYVGDLIYDVEGIEPIRIQVRVE